MTDNPNNIKRVKNVPDLLVQEEKALNDKKQEIKNTLTNLQKYLENLNKYLVCKYNKKNATNETTNNDPDCDSNIRHV
jgi:hypothetical protein